MPLVNRTFDQLIDFTRTTAGTYVDSTGKIVNTPASRNLLTFTQQFDNAAWTKSNATVTANTSVAPDGTTTADLLVPNTSSVNHAIQQSVTTSSTVVISVYAKAAGYDRLAFSSNNNNYVYFNLSSGTVESSLGTGWTAASITAVGNGWYRCQAATATAQTRYDFLPFNAAQTNGNTAPTFAGDGTSGILIWGAQLEQASAATDYTRNVGGLFPPRFDYDPVTLAPRGLLIEEQRVNLFTYSEQFDNAVWVKGAGYNSTITANSTTAPDGTLTADTLVADSAGGTGSVMVARAQAVTSGVFYTLSFFAKASTLSWIRLFLLNYTSPGNGGAYFNLSGSGSVGTVDAGYTATIAAHANGWYRCTLSFTAGSSVTGEMRLLLANANNDTAVARNGTSSAFIWGAQLEAGAFATSYIPTVASQVTRAADVAAITGPNFTPWYNQSAGTFVVEGSRLHGGNSYAALAVARAAGGITERIDMGLGSGQGGSAGVSRDDVVVGGVNQAALGDFAAFAANTPYRGALAYAANDFASATSGANLATDASGTVPTVALLDLGNRNSGNFLNGHIRSIRFYPSRLTNAQLQALTA